MATPPKVPAGWYDDPSALHELRYWDGTGWTAHVSDAGIAATDQPGARPPLTSEDPDEAPPAAGPPAAAPAPRRRRKWGGTRDRSRGCRGAGPARRPADLGPLEDPPAAT